MEKPSLKKGLLPDLSPQGDARAVELPGVGFPVPFGDEEGQGVPDEVVWALGKVRAISEHNWVFRGWLVDNSTKRGALSKVAINEATEEESDQEVVANNLDVHPKVFGLRASGDIIEQVPERNKC